MAIKVDEIAFKWSVEGKISVDEYYNTLERRMLAAWDSDIEFSNGNDLIIRCCRVMKRNGELLSHHRIIIDRIIKKLSYKCAAYYFRRRLYYFAIYEVYIRTLMMNIYNVIENVNWRIGKVTNYQLDCLSHLGRKCFARNDDQYYYSDVIDDLQHMTKVVIQGDDSFTYYEEANLQESYNYDLDVWTIKDDIVSYSKNIFYVGLLIENVIFQLLLEGKFQYVFEILDEVYNSDFSNISCLENMSSTERDAVSLYNVLHCEEDRLFDIHEHECDHCGKEVGANYVERGGCMFYIVYCNKLCYDASEFYDRHD
jgi:hypothetical protein